MKTGIIIAIAGAVAAQNLSGEPACATSCLISAISAAGCGPSDMACQCGPTQSAIGGLAAPCLIKACTNGADLIQAASVGTALCQSYLATATTAVLTTTSSNSTVVKPTGSNSTTTGAVTTGATTGGSNGTVVTQKPTTTKTTQTTSSTNAAATPMVYGAGAVIGFLGVLAAL